MRPLHLLLVRHGESDDNEASRVGGDGDASLTTTGRWQAEQVAARLRQEPSPRSLFSSDLPRALQTAEIIGAALELDVHVVPDLRERAMGELTGLTFDAVQQRYPALFRALRQDPAGATPPGGETPSECAARIERALELVAETAEPGPVVLVGHAFAFGQFVRDVVFRARAEVQLRQGNCALHEVSRRATGAWVVQALNDARHLQVAP